MALSTASTSHPKVSVIIPTFNRAHCLGQAIQSVLHQTFGDLELVVVDDGSTDHTPEALRHVGDDRLRILVREHRGISAALNVGIRTARGAYIARLDSDDLWLPHMLATLVPFLDRRPEIGAVYGGAQPIDKEGNPLPFMQGIPQRYPGDSLKSLLYEDCTVSIATVIRRSCFEDVGLYDESLKTGEDWDMTLRIARHYRLAYVEEVVAQARYHEGNTTGPRSALFVDALDGRVKVLDKFFSNASLPISVPAMKPVAYRNLHTAVCIRWLQAGEVRKASRSFWRAFRSGATPTWVLARIARFAVRRILLDRVSWKRRFVQEIGGSRRCRRKKSSAAGNKQ